MLNRTECPFTFTMLLILVDIIEGIVIASYDLVGLFIVRLRCNFCMS